MCLESSGKPDAGKLARPVWGWGRGAIPRPTPPAARGGELLAVTNEIQLTSYGYAYRHDAGVRECQLQIRRLIKTKKPQIETHSYPARTDAHFCRLFALIRAYLDDLNSDSFTYRPGWSCSMCDFRDGPCSDWCGR